MDGSQPSTGLRDARAAQPDAASSGLQADTASHGAYGELLRRVVKSPLNFAFNWRGVDFTGTFDAHQDGIALTLHSDLAALPYSAENAGQRDQLLAVVDAFRGDALGKLKVVSGQKIVIESGIDLSDAGEGTVGNIIAGLTIMVLRVAPYLDLLAEGAAPHGTSSAENA